MALLNASQVFAWMYRGTEYTLNFSVTNDNGDDYEFDGTEEVVLRLSSSFTDEYSKAEVVGVIDSIGGSTCSVSFAKEDTEDLPAGAYDLTLLVDDWPVLHTRFGIVGTNPGVDTNE